MSGNPTTPSNVVAMPTNWPGPMFTPKTWPSSPSCFSELAGLNACYDSVQMMEQILAKVVTDLATNNVAFQQALVEAIAKSGSNVPLIGVTNGSNAQPGQVGEFYVNQQTLTIPTTLTTSFVTGGILPPGDWDLWAWAQPAGPINVLTFGLQLPLPGAYTSNNCAGVFMWTVDGNEQITLASPLCRVSSATQTLLPFGIVAQAPAATTSIFQVEARRVR